MGNNCPNCPFHGYIAVDGNDGRDLPMANENAKAMSKASSEALNFLA